MGKRKPGRPLSREAPSLRATVSLPPDIYRTLGALAKQRKVSMAWVIRDAAEKYVAEQWPLFGNTQ
jgi:predicted transcriptional regulator